MSTGDAPVTMTPAEVAAAMPTKATTQRDELADLLATSAGWERDSLDEDQADVILAAGFTKPRTVTTVAELDAAIIRCFEEGEPLTLRAKDGRPFILWEDEDGTLHVTSYPQEGDVNPLSITDIKLPAVAA